MSDACEDACRAEAIQGELERVNVYGINVCYSVSMTGVHGSFHVYRNYAGT